MKKYFLITIFVLLTVVSLNARVITIEVGPGSSRTFVPSTVNDAHVGDTVTWVWSSGDHTTTSVTIPSGAMSWDEPINSSSTTYSYVILVSGAYFYKCTPHESMGMVGSINASEVTGINQIGSIANKFELAQNFPNPFNPVTSIKFSIQENSFVKLNIYDITGKVIANLVNSNLSTGEYKYDFNASNLSSGVYFYRIEADNASGNTRKFLDTKQMVLIK